MMTSIVVDTTRISIYWAEKILDRLEEMGLGTINAEYANSSDTIIDAIEISGEFTDEEIDAIVVTAEDYGGEIISVA